MTKRSRVRGFFSFKTKKVIETLSEQRGVEERETAREKKPFIQAEPEKILPPPLPEPRQPHSSLFPSSRLKDQRSAISTLSENEKKQLRKVILISLEKYLDASPQNKNGFAEPLCRWMQSAPIEQVIKYTLHSTDLAKFCKEYEALKPYWTNHLNKIGVVIPKRLTIQVNAFDLLRGHLLYREYLSKRDELIATPEGCEKLKAYCERISCFSGFRDFMFDHLHRWDEIQKESFAGCLNYSEMKKLISRASDSVIFNDVLGTAMSAATYLGMENVLVARKKILEESMDVDTRSRFPSRDIHEYHFLNLLCNQYKMNTLRCLYKVRHLVEAGLEFDALYEEFVPHAFCDGQDYGLTTWDDIDQYLQRQFDLDSWFLQCARQVAFEESSQLCAAHYERVVSRQDVRKTQ